MQSKNLACTAVWLLLIGCGDAGGSPSSGGAGGGSGGSSSSEVGGGGAGVGAAGQGGEGGGVVGEPCGEGPISAACVCGDASYSTGSCCSGQWFDPYYDTLIAGCPDASAFRYVDPAHPAASDSALGSADAPWASIEHGVATVAAGQVLIVRPGTYQVVCTGERHTPALNPASGTEGAPVIIKAEGDVIIEPAAVSQGTAQGGTAANIVLEADEPSADNAYWDHHVRIVAGTGAGQARQIMRDFDNLSLPSYDGATRTAWVSLLPSGLGNWAVTPDSTSQYEVVRNGPLVGTNGRQHVVWDGFHVRERDSYAPDTGPVVVWASDHVVLLNNQLEAQTEYLYDNHNVVRIEGSTASVVRNNRIFGLGWPDDLGPNNPQNHAAIMIYGSHDLVIEHNEIDDVYTGIFPKGSDGSGHLIRRNVIQNCAKAFRFSYHSDLRVFQNGVVDCEGAFQFAENLSGILVFNNVVHGGVMGLNNWFPIAGASAFNNIFHGTESPAHFEGGVGSLTSDRNVFFGQSSFVPGGDLAGWQAQGFDASSIQADPQFVDVAAGDFHLAGGSPAATVGRDDGDVDGDGDTSETIPAGVYLTGDEVIGRLAEP